jgi:hypothetical protein
LLRKRGPDWVYPCSIKILRGGLFEGVLEPEDGMVGRKRETARRRWDATLQGDKVCGETCRN